MSSNELRFDTLRRMLLDLGFTDHVVQQKYRAFDHLASDTTFLFRLYRPQDKVSSFDIEGVRKQLDWRGLLSEEDFDALLRKVSA